MLSNSRDPQAYIAPDKKHPYELVLVISHAADMTESSSPMRTLQRLPVCAWMSRRRAALWVSENMGSVQLRKHNFSASAEPSIRQRNVPETHGPCLCIRKYRMKYRSYRLGYAQAMNGLADVLNDAAARHSVQSTSSTSRQADHARARLAFRPSASHVYFLLGRPGLPLRRRTAPSSPSRRSSKPVKHPAQPRRGPVQSVASVFASVLRRAETLHQCMLCVKDKKAIDAQPRQYENGTPNN